MNPLPSNAGKDGVSNEGLVILTRDSLVPKVQLFHQVYEYDEVRSNKMIYSGRSNRFSNPADANGYYMTFNVDDDSDTGEGDLDEVFSGRGGGGGNAGSRSLVSVFKVPTVTQPLVYYPPLPYLYFDVRGAEYCAHRLTELRGVGVCIALHHESTHIDFGETCRKKYNAWLKLPYAYLKEVRTDDENFVDETRMVAFLDNDEAISLSHVMYEWLTSTIFGDAFETYGSCAMFATANAIPQACFFETKSHDYVADSFIVLTNMHPNTVLRYSVYVKSHTVRPSPCVVSPPFSPPPIPSET